MKGWEDREGHCFSLAGWIWQMTGLDPSIPHAAENCLSSQTGEHVLTPGVPEWGNSDQLAILGFHSNSSNEVVL